jgi:hypothetical protein
LNKSQEIVFQEDEDDQQSKEDIPTITVPYTQKLRENALPALVGMGAMLLGFGQPLMTKPAGRIAIAQGRRNRALSISSQQQQQENSLTRRNTTDNHSPRNVTAPNSPTIITSSPSSPASDYSNTSNNYISSSQPDLHITAKKRSSHFNPFTSSPSLEDLHKGKAFSVSRYIKNAQQKLNRKMIQLGEEQILSKKASGSSLNNLEKKKKKHFQDHLSVFDPKLTALGQSSVPTNTAPLSPALSECSSSEEILTTKKHIRLSTKLSTSFESYDSDNSISSNGINDDEDDDEDDEEEKIRKSLSKMSTDNRKSLLRSNYFRSEMQFLLALVDIATRLVIVPKEARMSALHAELTLLNHNLPAEICLPLWCPATCEKPYHHRIVRISPSDAVVLNSAERVSSFGKMGFGGSYINIHVFF